MNVKITPERLGNMAFKKEYGIKYAYLSGSMYRGISSKELVVKMGKAGLLGFFGTAGFTLDQIKEGIDYIQGKLCNGESYGMNLICDLDQPAIELDTILLYLEHGIKQIEASAFMQITLALALYRLQGLHKNGEGQVVCEHKIIAKISRPEVAEVFMSPAPERIVTKLLEEKKITEKQAELAKEVPMSYDICVEADSGGHTDQGIPTVLLPAMQSLRKEIMDKHDYKQGLRIGLAGGIGTPEAAAAAFIMGADFILTGSINQCTVESGMSSSVKELLQAINVQDTDYAPAGDMFEIGARVQVLKKGVFFPARANKLYMLYTHYASLEEIPDKIKTQLQEKYFKKSFDEIWEETKDFFIRKGQAEIIEKAARNPKQKMALVSRWYFGYSMRLAFSDNGGASHIDYQVHTGPALGAFNQWVKGTELEDWKNRHVDEIGEKLMQETAVLLTQNFQHLQG